MSHSPLKFGRSFFRRCGWQGGKTLKACGVLRYSCDDQIVGSPCQCHALLRLKVVQSWRGHGELLDIYPALIHQRQPLLPQVVELLLDFPTVEPVGTLLSDRRCCPGSTDVSSDKILFDSDDFHGVIFLITRSRLHHHGIVTFSQRVNVPVGPSESRSATRTTSREPSSTDSVPSYPLRFVLVNPGETRLTLIPVDSSSIIMAKFIALRAALDAGYTGP